MVKFVLDPDNLSETTADESATDMTDEQITVAALSDPDNPPLTDDELDVLSAAIATRRARKRLDMTQREFSARYRIGYGRLRDIEQGRNITPDSALLAYLKVIEREPDAVARALDSP